MKKLLCVILVLLMTAAGFTALAQNSAWEFDAEDYKLTGYDGEGGAVIIPQRITGCTVDILGMDVFADNDAVTSLTLPSTLKQVEDNAIAFCDNLTELVIPKGVQIIGDNCFICNPLLTEVVIPASVRYIGASSFGSNESLAKVTFLGECPVFAGAALDWIADDAVVYVPDDQYDAYAEALYAAECYSDIQPSGANAVVYNWATDPSLFDFDASTGTIKLYNGFDACVEIPAEIDGVAVKAIGEHAFESHRYLCFLTLPEGLETIGESAFEWCSNLKHVNFPSTLKTIESRAFYAGYHGSALELTAVETIGESAFAWCVRISETITLPEGLRIIGDHAFDGCSWLSEVYIPASVEAIGEKAFADSAVNYLVFEGKNLPRMAENTLADCWYLTDIDLHTDASKKDAQALQAAVDALGLECYVWRMQNPDVDYINDGLDVYENGVLISYAGDQSHIRPWDTFDDITVTAVADGAFRGNQTIEYFAVPYNDEFTTIGAEAFADSTLHTIDLFDSVTTINGGALRNCVNLTELILPESIEFVGAETLYGCTGLKTLIVLCDSTVLPEDLFDVWPAGLEIYVSDNATDEQVKYLSRIAGRPFYDPVTRLSEELPMLDAMPYEPLPGEDFWYDAEYARLDCYEGYELNLVLPWEIDGTRLTMIGGGMMQRASYGDNYDVELPVVSVVIPETYTDIPPYAFQNCETLETVICYAPLDRISDSLFSNCTSLREVIFVNGVGGIGAYVFDNCPNLETVYVGPYVDTVSEYAFCVEFGEPLWSMDKCITDPALMPDVDALLGAVKREPMPKPTPEPTPEPAVPVGEEGAPYFGVWNGVEMIMDGVRMSMAEYDIVMTLLLLEDGRMISADEAIDLSDPSVLDEVDAASWRVAGGVAIGDGYTMTLDDQGRLVLDEDGSQLIFERAGDLPEGLAAQKTPAGDAAPSATPAPQAAVQGSALEVMYVCASADVSGVTVDASMLGGKYTLIFHEDGTAEFVVAGTALPGIGWKRMDDGEIWVDYCGMLMETVSTPTGFDLNYFNTMLMHFVPENR
ncbi:MAG: leucine-rich repeat domain-containing protein [Clostridia bacterium]|nr:leucine-rich repeat domain-containing protein [Clostridia bacterium]